MTESVTVAPKAPRSVRPRDGHVDAVGTASSRPPVDVVRCHNTQLVIRIDKDDVSRVAAVRPDAQVDLRGDRPAAREAQLTRAFSAARTRLTPASPTRDPLVSLRPPGKTGKVQESSFVAPGCANIVRRPP